MLGFIAGALCVAAVFYAWKSKTTASTDAKLEADYRSIHAQARAELDGDSIVRLTAALKDLQAFGLSDPEIRRLNPIVAKRVMLTKAIQTVSSYLEINRMFQPVR